MKSLAWVSAGEDKGYLAIGQLDGTCALVGLTSQLEITGCEELKLDKDYRPVEMCNQVKVRLNLVSRVF